MFTKIQMRFETSVTNTAVLPSWYINAKFCDFSQRAKSTSKVLLFRKKSTLWEHFIGSLWSEIILYLFFFPRNYKLSELLALEQGLNNYNKKWLTIELWTVIFREKKIETLNLRTHLGS